MSSTEGAEKSGPEEPVAAAEDVAEVETTDPDKASSSRSRGIVKWFSVTKGKGCSSSGQCPSNDLVQI